MSCKTLAEVLDEHIVKVLKNVNGNKTKAAKILGVSIRTVQRRARQINNNTATTESDRVTKSVL